MTLASLKPGETGVITSINVTGDIKRRLMDMGLLVGETVKVERTAPFGDPMEIIIKGYSLSLRKKEAEGIALDTGEECSARHLLEKQEKVFTVAVAGNPNAGKSTLINAIAGTRLHVGNWPGVTVAKREAIIELRGKTIKLVDLPGTYSLNPSTQEQIIARDFLVHQKPDIILNVVDSTNLERNLYLTIQLLELGIPIILALNIYDEAEGKGYKIDIGLMEELLGVKVVTTVSTRRSGVSSLLDALADVTNDACSNMPRQLGYGEDLENAVADVVKNIREHFPKMLDIYPPKWLALKLIEMDRHVLKETEVDADAVLSGVAFKHLKLSYGEDLESIVSDMRYAKASGLTREVLYKPSMVKTELTKTIDAVVLNKYLGLPIFIAAMWLMFKLTFDISTPFKDWIDAVTKGPLSRWGDAALASASSPPWLSSLVTEGIIGGAGFVLVFVPIITAMMLFITFLEGSGYMARAAFVMDRAMHSMGLHGNSFIPMLLGFGCNVPAIYATRTLDNPKDRILTSLLVPMMSCGARLPVYVLFVGAFFEGSAGTVLWSLYMLGIVLAVVMGIVFRRTLFKGDTPMFILELPPYRMPTLRNLLIHTWEKVKHFIIKAGTYILAASIVVWFLLHIPFGVIDKKDSLLGKTGQAIAPILKPLGFGTWEASASLITGIMAKEIVVGTMGEIYASARQNDSGPSPSFTQDVKEIASSFVSASRSAVTNVISTFGISSLSTQEDEKGKGIVPFIRKTFTPLSAYAFMVFVLLYMPCMVTAVAFKQEFGTWKWFGVAMAYGFVLAWTSSFIIYQMGTLFGLGG